MSFLYLTTDKTQIDLKRIDARPPNTIALPPLYKDNTENRQQKGNAVAWLISPTMLMKCECKPVIHGLPARWIFSAGHASMFKNENGSVTVKQGNFPFMNNFRETF